MAKCGRLTFLLANGELRESSMEMLKKLFFLAGNSKSRLKFIFSLMALRGLAKVIPLVILYLIIIELFCTDLNLGKILKLAIYLGIFFLLINIWDHYLELFTIRSGYKLSYDIRMELGDKLTKLSLGFFVRNPTGELNTTMGEYVSRVEDFISFGAPHILSYSVSAFAMMIFFLFLDWRMAVACASVLPLVLIAFACSDKIAERVTKAREESLRRTNSLIVEFIQGMKVIQIFNRVSSNFYRYRKTMKDFRDKNVKAVASMTIPTIIFITFTSLTIVVLLPLGIYLYSRNSLSLSILVFFIIATTSFSDSIANCLYAYIHVKSPINQAMKHISEVLKEKPLLEPEHDVKLKKFDIEFVNVIFSYEEIPVLNDISFRIPEKSVTALVGESGAGKTTIANLIARFWDADSGEIIIGGRNIRELKLDRLLSYISIVFQDVILFNDTIKENIRLGKKDADDKEIILAAGAARCHEFIKDLPDGYNTIIGEKGARLSEGEKQRISIARAILKNAPILILDEATVYVDPENEKLIQEAINQLTKNKTVLVIAHRLSTITSSDQILVLDRGRIVEKGRHQELVAVDGLYRKLWDAHRSAQGWKF